MMFFIMNQFRFNIRRELVGEARHFYNTYLSVVGT
ncbi:hypothetical protein BAU18_002942 [Enterococcus diestrammenae]|uniref:ABC transporter permease n=1 Tax=Enterococcus diestrammenae TaxID=1155073 RepID=A0ABV0F5N7_9ENTE